MGYLDKLSVQIFEGGILEWNRQGNPTIVRRRNHLPLMRQTQVAAGLGILAFTALGYWVSPAYLLLSGFFGAGLTVAGATGFCGMANLLALMPWNRIEPRTEEEFSQISPAHPTALYPGEP